MKTTWFAPARVNEARGKGPGVPFLRLRGRRAFALGLLFAAACSVPWAGRYTPSAPSRAREVLAEVIRTLGRRGPEEVIPRLEDLVRRYPDFVEAHRYLQDLYLADHREGELLNRYRALLDRNPRSPAHHYLYGRLLSASAGRLRHFRAAVEADPSFYWGYNGLGYTLAARGDTEGAVEAFRRAARSAPDRREAWIGLVTTYVQAGERERAEAVLDEAGRRFPRDPALAILRARCVEAEKGPLAAARALLDDPGVRPGPGLYAALAAYLERASNEDLLRRVFFRFTPRAGEGSEPGLALLLGLAAERLGNLEAAVNSFSRALRSSSTAIQARRSLRYLYAVAGRLPEAFDVELADAPASWTEASPYRAAREAVCALARRLENARDPEERKRLCCEVGARLAALGWLDEAVALLAPAADRTSPAGTEAAELLDELCRHRRFELALGRFFTEQYRRFHEKGEALSWPQVLERLQSISREVLGRNVFTSMVTIDYRPVGWILDPRPSARCGPVEYFRRYNRFFLLGRKLGGPVEAYLLDLFSYEADRSVDAGGERIRFDLVRGEHLRIPSYIEYLGGGITGAGLERIVLVNLDEIRREAWSARETYRRFHGREALLLGDPAPVARDEEEALAVEEPLGLPVRLTYLSFRDHGVEQGMDAYLEDRFQGVLVHEVQHLVDARRFLPVQSHLLWSLYRFAACGFSAYNVQAWLEQRAQLRALAEAPDPRAALAETAAQLEVPPRSASPHRKGYVRLLSRLAAYVHDHPERFPEVDRGGVVLHQLFRLSPEELRSAARALARETGLEGISVR